MGNFGLGSRPPGVHIGEIEPCYSQYTCCAHNMALFEPSHGRHISESFIPIFIDEVRDLLILASPVRQDAIMFQALKI